MRLTRAVRVLALLGFTACGEHYEGGGRRDEVPTEESSQGPNIGSGDGTSTQGGSTSASAGTLATEPPGGESGSGGTFPFAGLGGTIP
jgi:hypothetical protein